MYSGYLDRLIQVLKSTQMYGSDGRACSSYDEAVQKLLELFSMIKGQGKQLFFIGNGGSAAIASHMTADFMKNGGMKTYSLYDSSVTTCMGNDYGYEYIFSRPLEFLANPGDLLVAVSSSGNSLNIINAIRAAAEKQMQVVTFSGFQKENKISGMGRYNVYVPCSSYGIVESVHNLMLQQIVDMIAERDGECL